MAIKKLCPFKLWTLQNFPFIAEDFDALTNYELMCKIVEYLNNVIKLTNEQTISIETLEKSFNDLKDYVDNYFENLDIQEEVNNKLDEMAQSGELQELISEYLNSNALITFNTLNDLKSATNLIAGSKVRTLGYHTYDDKGGAFYLVREVTNQDVENDGDIVALSNNNLVAELLPYDEINFLIFGAYGDGTTDDTTAVINGLNYANSNKLNINLMDKNYYVTSLITINDIKLKNGKITTTNYINLENSVKLEKVDITGSYKEATIRLINTNDLLINNCYIIGGILCRTHANNTKIINSIFKGHGYHILFDDQISREYTDTIGKTFICENTEFIIDDNNFTGDLIEINTPNYSFKNIFINNCYAHLDDNVNNPVQYSTAQIGFGFANVDNIVIDNNILDSVSAGNGVLHFELCNDINVTNNQIINTKDVQYSNTYNAILIIGSEKVNINNNIITDYPIGIWMINDNLSNTHFLIENNYFKCYRYGIYGNKAIDFTITNNRMILAVKNNTITTQLQGISVYEYGGVVGIQNSIISDNYFYLPTNILENGQYTYSLNLSSENNTIVNNNYTRGIGKGNNTGTNAGSGYKVAVGNNEKCSLTITNSTPVNAIDGNSKNIVLDTNNGVFYKYIDGSWKAGQVIYNDDMRDYEQTSTRIVALTVFKKSGVKCLINTSTTSTSFTQGQEYNIMTINEDRAKPSITVRTTVTTMSNHHFNVTITNDGSITLVPLENIPSGANIRFSLVYV